LLEASEAGISGVWFPNRALHQPASAPVNPGLAPGVSKATAALELACDQLSEYFAGKRRAFDLNLDPHGTDFELRVWGMLREIPFGSMTSYGAIAKRLGDPTLARAVGAANGANPIPIIVPCHRVVGARGELTGFGGGIERKRWLLQHEGALMI